MDTGAYMQNQMDDLIELGIQERDALETELSVLKEKIKNSEDYFFIYGWQKRVEEINRKLKQ